MYVVVHNFGQGHVNSEDLKSVKLIICHFRCFFHSDHLFSVLVVKVADQLVWVVLV